MQGEIDDVIQFSSNEYQMRSKIVRGNSIGKRFISMNKETKVMKINQVYEREHKVLTNKLGYKKCFIKTHGCFFDLFFYTGNDMKNRLRISATRKCSVKINHENERLRKNIINNCFSRIQFIFKSI